MLPHDLTVFGLGYCHIWILWAESGIIRLTDSNHLETELYDYRIMLKRRPDDQILQNMVAQAEWRLRETLLAEEDQAKDISGNDLAYCKQFLALRASDLRKMKLVFRKNIDLDRDKHISIEDLCSFIREPLSMSPFLRRIFALSSASSSLTVSPQGQGSKVTEPKNDEAIFDLGHTMKAITVFCMLSQLEVIRFVFASYDTRGFGQIANSQFLELLSMFHPRYRDNVVTQAMKEIELSSSCTMSYATFESDCRRLPQLLYPALRVQDKLRKKTFGLRWWNRKLRLYAEAKERVDHQRRAHEELEQNERRRNWKLAAELQEESMNYYSEKRRRKSKTSKRG